MFDQVYAVYVVEHGVLGHPLTLVARVGGDRAAQCVGAHEGDNLLSRHAELSRPAQDVRQVSFRVRQLSGIRLAA